MKFNSVEPYTKSRLNALPFADIIRDYKVISDGVVPENPLKFLYPDIPKDDAFGRLYNSAPNKGTDPYTCCVQFVSAVFCGSLLGNFLIMKFARVIPVQPYIPSMLIPISVR